MVTAMDIVFLQMIVSTSRLSMNPHMNSLSLAGAKLSLFANAPRPQDKWRGLSKLFFFVAETTDGGEKLTVFFD